MGLRAIIAEYGRPILVSINLIALIIGLVIFSLGCAWKYILEMNLLTNILELDTVLIKEFDSEGVTDVTALPFVGGMSLVLIIFGLGLSIVSMTACSGACFKSRLLLSMFIVFLAVLIIAGIILSGTFLHKDSSLATGIKYEFGQKIRSDYVHTTENGTADTFSRTINVMNVLLECCGARGKNDFKVHPAASCCKKFIFLITPNDTYSTTPQQCWNGTAHPRDLNQQGCFDRILDLIQRYKAAVIVPSVILVVILALEILFAAILINQISNEDMVL